MSYDLYVYTAEISVEKLSFSIEMLNRGWRVVYLPVDAFDEGVETTFLPDHGRLDGMSIIAAWGTDEKRANSLEDLVAAQNWKGLREHELDGFGLAQVGFTTGRINHLNDGDEQEVHDTRARTSSREIEVSRAARSYYALVTHTGCNPLSMELQEASWRVIAKLSQGHAVDPQTDEEFVGEPIPKRNFLQHWFHKLTTPGI